MSRMTLVQMEALKVVVHDGDVITIEMFQEESGGASTDRS